MSTHVRDAQELEHVNRADDPHHLAQQLSGADLHFIVPLAGE